jgi:large conductance mechanosensitive channel
MMNNGTKEEFAKAANELKNGTNEKVKGAKKFVQEFKEFALRGNMIDMAVGIVIGTAFTAMVTSIVSDIIMPAISYFIGGADYASLHWHGILYGKTITTIINFFIIAFVVFIIVKTINKLSKLRKGTQDQEAEQTAELKEEVALLKDIRDLLKEGQSK